jgi:hypothetical protein
MDMGSIGFNIRRYRTSVVQMFRLRWSARQSVSWRGSNRTRQFTSHEESSDVLYGMYMYRRSAYISVCRIRYWNNGRREARNCIIQGDAGRRLPLKKNHGGDDLSKETQKRNERNERTNQAHNRSSFQLTSPGSSASPRRQSASVVIRHPSSIIHHLAPFYPPFPFPHLQFPSPSRPALLLPLSPG